MDHDDATRMLKAIATAFDEHDLDGIMAHFADDAVFEGPRGTGAVGYAVRRAGQRSARPSPPDSPGSPTSDIRRMRTSSTVIAAHPSGPCRARRPTDSGSKSGAAICGRFATGRS